MNAKHTCKHCHEPLEVIEQKNFRGGSYELGTCKNPTCEKLFGVTLEVGALAALTDEQIAEYAGVVLSYRQYLEKAE